MGATLVCFLEGLNRNSKVLDFVKLPISSWIGNDFTFLTIIASSDNLFPIQTSYFWAPRSLWTHVQTFNRCGDILLFNLPVRVLGLITGRSHSNSNPRHLATGDFRCFLQWNSVVSSHIILISILTASTWTLKLCKILVIIPMHVWFDAS